MYEEIRGTFLSFEKRPQPVHRLVFSDLEKAYTQTGGASLALKYVARGRVIHRYGAKQHVVQAGQFICVPSNVAGELEVPRSGGSSMIGICAFMPMPDPPHWMAEGAIEQPLTFSASSSRIGRMLQLAISDLRRPAPGRTGRAEAVLTALRSGLEPLLEETLANIDALPSVRAATRYELLRRLNLARGHLHDVTDRAVGIAELARVAGISQFELLRNFRRCFGVPPATYHRLLRLRLAMEQVEREAMTCAQAAQAFGFADGSSFSHAYRRAFGAAPVRTLTAQTDD